MAWTVVSWSPGEPITDTKMDAMVANDEYLKAVALRGIYKGLSNNPTKQTGIRIACGIALITARTASTASKYVSFGSYFSEGCRPIITTGLNSGFQRKVWVSVDGPGTNILPTRDGFHVHVAATDTGLALNIPRNLYIGWHAVGY